MIKVFKFGGASIKGPDEVKNMASIVGKNLSSQLLIITSAMGKTTNQLESLLSEYLKNENWLNTLEAVVNFHVDAANELFLEDHHIFKDIESIILRLEKYLLQHREYPTVQLYSRVVSTGELLSTQIVSAYLNDNIKTTQLLDAREYVITDTNYVDAHVNWNSTNQKINEEIPQILEDSIVLTQGFIGSNVKRETTTLGREGSDFSGAVFAKCLGAESLTVWKDVPGILTADPKLMSNASKIEYLTYKEASEMTFYGAKVIHPKTIRPLSLANIELHVKPFNAPEEAGTVISQNGPLKYPPIYILKKDQTLLSFKVEDLSFIDESKMGLIFDALYEQNIKVNLMENSAVSFSICIDTKFDQVEQLIQNLKAEFKIAYNQNLELFTIKNYNRESLLHLKNDRPVLLEQKSRNAIHVLYAKS